MTAAVVWQAQAATSEGDAPKRSSSVWTFAVQEIQLSYLQTLTECLQRVISLCFSPLNFCFLNRDSCSFGCRISVGVGGHSTAAEGNTDVRRMQKNNKVKKHKHTLKYYYIE